MAIARDAYTDLGSVTATSLTASHTCTGSNLNLYVLVYLQNSAGQGDEITGVTYNGVAMSRIGVIDYNATSGNYVYIYGLAGPTTGAHNVVISCSASRSFQARAVSYTGASQTLPTGNAVKTYTSSSSNTMSMSPVSIGDGSWAVTIVRNLDGSFTDGTNCISLDGLASVAGCDSNTDMGTAGTETVSATTGGATRWAAVTAVFAPPAVGPANVKTYNGTAFASVKTINGTAVASVKTFNGTA